MYYNESTYQWVLEPGDYTYPDVRVTNHTYLKKIDPPMYNTSTMYVCSKCNMFVPRGNYCINCGCKITEIKE